MSTATGSCCCSLDMRPPDQIPTAELSDIVVDNDLFDLLLSLIPDDYTLRFVYSQDGASLSVYTKPLSSCRFVLYRLYHLGLYELGMERDRRRVGEWTRHRGKEDTLYVSQWENGERKTPWTERKPQVKAAGR